MWINRRFRLPEIATGTFCAALGLYMLADVWMKPAIAAKAAVGPGVFPALVGAGLVLVGLRLLQEAWQRRSWPTDLPQLDLKSAALGAAAFLAMVMTLDWLGWIVAGTAMYVAIARIFGSRNLVASLALGLALTTGTFVLFDYGLDLSLPIGTLFEPVAERIFPTL
jgi:putative tricarboxylic transport membrane protein